jgi:hypothetical protein
LRKRLVLFAKVAAAVLQWPAANSHRPSRESLPLLLSKQPTTRNHVDRLRAHRPNRRSLGLAIPSVTVAEWTIPKLEASCCNVRPARLRTIAAWNASTNTCPCTWSFVVARAASCHPNGPKLRRCPRQTSSKPVHSIPPKAVQCPLRTMTAPVQTKINSHKCNLSRVVLPPSTAVSLPKSQSWPSAPLLTARAPSRILPPSRAQW